jgi:hypothetical protein
VTRALDRVDEGSPKPRTTLFEHAHSGIDALLLRHRERVPPLAKLVCELDFPHRDTIS